MNAPAGDVAEEIEAMKESSTDYLVLRALLEAQGEAVEEDAEDELITAEALTGEAAAGGGAIVATTQRTTPSGLTITIESESLAVEAMQVATADGQTQVRYNGVTYERTSIRITLEPEQTQQTDPLVLDLDGDGIETTGVDKGVRFDLDADGRTDRASVVTGGDAFLARDADGDGRIDNGRELFGDRGGAAHGFAALAAHDGNGDGQIDSADAVWSELRLLRFDANGAQRLGTLDEAGVKSISLGYQNQTRALNAYDAVAQVGSFTRQDGSVGAAADLLLGYRTT
ncbi:MAG: hypothetical protein C4523_05670 [Myxococcales bacterium]|nr:MAG: hypothetical protein C4523_05670 [Myxococcales bacterium]